ncbi:MAG: hypothetical protein SFT81_02745 [Candidatus Caenarcaniphilales bacterium]|nr:hypothetical protein [Candidatus Caenarcaniphilales bacterium]
MSFSKPCPLGLIFIFFVVLCLSLEIKAEDRLFPIARNESRELKEQIRLFCEDRGQIFVTLYQNIRVDCLTSDTLWRIDYADQWSNALTEALTYPIYFVYRGEERLAPRPGVVLIQRNQDDYHGMVRLKQLVKHYNLPVRLEVIDDYGGDSPKPPSKIIKNLRFDLSRLDL